MARQKPWDQYEAVILLEAYIKVHEGTADRKQAIMDTSRALRKKALMEGEDIDEIFRNEAGITFQMYSMESAYLGHTVRKPATKLFTKVVENRQKDRSEYDRILTEAKKMIEKKKSMEEQFYTWLSRKVSPAQLSELYTVFAPIDEFCQSRKILRQSLFKTTDLNELTKVKETVERNKVFRFKYKRQTGRMSSAICQYIDFVKEENQKETAEKAPVIIKHSKEKTVEIDRSTAERAKEPDNSCVLALSRIDNLAYSTPVSFQYKGVIHAVNSWRNVYIDACKCLDEDFPYVFKALAGRSISGTGRIDVGTLSDTRIMVAPKAISDQYVVETNLSATDLMKRLGALIEICDFDYELLTVTYRKGDTTAQSGSAQVSNSSDQLQNAKTAYMEWMRQNGMAEKSLPSYISSTNRCSEYAQEHGYLDRSLFFITEASDVHQLMNTLMADSEFSSWNKSQYNRYKIALDKYLLFRKDKNFVASIHTSITQRSFDETTIEKYKAVLDAKFEKGYRLESSIDLRKFKKAFEAKVGESIETDDYIIKQIIKCCGIEHEGKLYLPKTMLSEEKKEQLLSYIDELFSSGKALVYYSAVFKEFTETFDGERIYTPEMLKAYLEYVASGKYFFERQYLSMSRNVKTEPIDEIRSFLIDKGEAVETDEICVALSHLPEKKITQILGSNGEFARNSKGVYFHTDLIALSDDQLNKISNLIQDDIDRWGYAIGNEIINNVRLKYPDILEPYNHFSELGLRNVLAYRLGDRYAFNSNVISECGKNLSMSDVYANFSRQHKHFTLAELEVLKEETGSGVIYLGSVYSNALRISEKEFVSFENAHFDVEQTDAAISRYLTEDYIPIANIGEFGTFPYAGYPWNSFLLESYVLNFSKNYKLINNVFNAYTCVGAIVKNSAGINDFQELLVHVLADSSCELYPEPALNYLYEKGYIGRRSNKDIEKILTDAKALRSKKGQ